ncbi:hypothetical protein HanRHA438_Chr17g0816611 [Helianthus annuus]|nr:hypothetical protein HanRHA438_Chr17g0816611 [Helianthus annuus]
MYILIKQDLSSLGSTFDFHNQETQTVPVQALKGLQVLDLWSANFPVFFFFWKTHTIRSVENNLINEGIFKSFACIGGNNQVLMSSYDNSSRLLLMSSYDNSSRSSSTRHHWRRLFFNPPPLAEALLQPATIGGSPPPLAEALLQPDTFGGCPPPRAEALLQPATFGGRPPPRRRLFFNPPPSAEAHIHPPLRKRLLFNMPFLRPFISPLPSFGPFTLSPVGTIFSRAIN